ncbi:MAG: anion transporter [Bacteroidetes bacterium]|nr:MAG: anion transporter [Bacteroidota bacterium]
MNRTRKIGFFAGPLSFFALLLSQPFEANLVNNVLAVAAWMLIWWILEVFPIFITALLPMVFFPALGILSVQETFMPYASPIVFLFLGGFIIALAMEERRLHERISYGLIRLTGTKPRQIILGFMIATALVAMWISNTATAVMLLPIALSVSRLLAEQTNDQVLLGRFRLLLMLGIAYAANIGGTMTLIGTPPNLVFAGYYFETFGTDFPFSRWFIFGLPTGGFLLFLTYQLLTKIIYPIKGNEIEGVKELIQKKWREMGKMTRPEISVLAVFTLTVGLWVFAQPINDLIGQRVFNNTNIAMLGGILMFITPVNWQKSEFILEWKSTVKLPWGILLLFGGGLTLAKGLETAGIIQSIGDYIATNVSLSPILLVTILTAFALFATELMSNVALVTVLLPVVIGIGESTGVDPLLLAIPVTLAASCAFMMPISTPPNAVVYSSGYVSVKQMMRAGFWLNLISIAVIVVVVMLVLA